MDIILSFQDSKCFIHCIADALYGDPNDIHPNQVSHYKQFEDRFDMTGIDMPMQLKDIPRFEKQNDISISVYGWEPTKKNKDQNKIVGALLMDYSL